MVPAQRMGKSACNYSLTSADSRTLNVHTYEFHALGSAKPAKRNPSKMKKLTSDRLRELLAYNPWTGEFRWRVSRGNMAMGEVAGRQTDQAFIKIRIDGRDYLAHRLAWLYMKRKWPTQLINHKNRVHSDNRWPNLREATNAETQAHALPRRAMSRGVDRLATNRYQARIKFAGQRFELGRYGTERAASHVYRLVARVAFGDFAAP